MQIITSVQIKNFRSIKAITRNLSLDDLTVFVGQNDNGKSNILRALNLFFNNQTDVGQTFRFSEDYCYHANSGTGSRKEVKIDLTIEPPKSRFKNAQTVLWTKRWKMDGSILESRIFVSNGKPVAPNDNISKWLDKLKYRYVPAIKGRDYFNTLMGELHDALNEAHGALMSVQGQGFISGIQKVTTGITKELTSQIGIASTIQVPADFKQLFSNLDFGSKQGSNTYHLKQRGDGIKIRHIPVILKYMAEQEKNVSIPGYVKPDTIWGFEEPENNLELRYAFELADTLKRYSSEIQILVTTHSPAFYALQSDGAIDVRRYYVQKDQGLCTTIEAIDNIAGDDIHEKMGLLPLITPYLEEANKAQKRIEELEREVENISPKNKFCIITEDNDAANLRLLLQANGFDLKKTEFFSYDGKDQIKGALVLGKYLKSKHPEMQVLVHRDRDYLSDEEVTLLDTRFRKAGIHFFCTAGVDVESHFVNREHIKLLTDQLTDEEIDALINAATPETRQDSIDRFIDHVLGTGRPPQNGYAAEIQRINAEYDKSPVRYRYGKKVLGLLKAKLHKAGCKGVRLESVSDALKLASIEQIARAD